jgi:Zn-dependent protease with chaperone function
MTNLFKTTFLLVLLTLLVVFSGFALGGERGMIVAFVFACFMNFGAYWFSDKIVLAISRSREYEADLGGARLCEEPLYLASALRKIDAISKRFPLRDAEPATAPFLSPIRFLARGGPLFLASILLWTIA